MPFSERRMSRSDTTTPATDSAAARIARRVRHSRSPNNELSKTAHDPEADAGERVLAGSPSTRKQWMLEGLDVLVQRKPTDTCQGHRLTAEMLAYERLKPPAWLPHQAFFRMQCPTTLHLVPNGHHVCVCPGAARPAPDLPLLNGISLSNGDEVERYRQARGKLRTPPGRPIADRTTQSDQHHNCLDFTLCLSPALLYSLFEPAPCR